MTTHPAHAARPGGDTTFVATRVTSSRLVGRSAELTELDAALSDAAEGRPSLAFIAGESGVGKSRLLSELAVQARARGARVECGDCVELGGDELPYAPIVAVLRSLAREDDPVLGELSASARGQLGTLLPELRDGTSAPDGAELAQSQLFEALLSLLEHLGQEQPLVLGIEDIHWADRSTRAFLSFLSRSLWTERVLVVATYRPDELHRRHPLRPVLAELERDSRSRRIALEPLTEDELAEQLTGILGADVPADLAARLFTRSEGNPLFTEELLAAGLDGRGALPATLRDALMVRVERLCESAQDLLRLLSAGRRVSHDVLAEASGLEPAELRGALREAAEAHLLEADEQDRYRFRHALLREVVHDDLLPGEHAELHLALARVLERRVAEHPGDPYLSSALAHHYLSAGDQPAALAAAVSAAKAAESVRAHGEAAQLLERALGIWDRVPDAEALAGETRGTLLMRLGADLQADGDFARAQATYERALEATPPDAGAHAAALVLERLAQVQWRLGRATEARDSIDRAIALLPEDDSPERARIMARNAKLMMLQGKFQQAVPAARDALEAARRASEVDAAGIALNALGFSLIQNGEVDEGRARLREAIAIAESPSDAAVAYVNLADALHVDGRSTEALDVIHEGVALMRAEKIDNEWLDGTAGEIEWELGDWESSRARTPEPQRGQSGTTLVFVALRRAEFALADGDEATATELLDRIEETVAGAREPQFIGWHGDLRAQIARRAGDSAAARRAVDDALDSIEFCSEDRQRIARLAQTGVSVEADAAERARDIGDADAERVAIAGAEAYLSRSEACADPPRPVEHARLATARAELARARGDSDPQLYADAAAAWLEAGRPYPAALNDLDRAAAFAAAGDRDAAQCALDDVVATAERLGAPWLLAQAHGLAGRARLSSSGEQEPVAAAPEPAPPADDPFGLTPRERQVLELLARGATNREIGAELFMAEKTASVHVSRILAKLDVRTRTEAAAVAYRLGLAA